MRIQVLGPIRVTDGASQLDLGGRQQRLVLALLAMYANESVSTDRILDTLWRDDPPATARKTVQGYISHLRRALGDRVIETTPNGYRLAVKRRDVDALEFEDRLSEARRLPDAVSRRFALRNALELWEGQAYEDVAGSVLMVPEIARLEELRMVATEESLAADLEAGTASEAVPTLESLVAAHPLRERLRALLMLALYRSGRQTDALREYEKGRRFLIEEAGLEPGPEIRALEQRMLDQDPTLDGPSALTAPRARTETANPYRGLRPFDKESADSFHGREALVRRLRDAIDPTATSRLLIVTGASGSGKTSVVQAGLAPVLAAAGRTVATVVPRADPVAEVAAALDYQPDVLIIDQLESALANREAAASLFNSIVTTATSPYGPWIIVTVRADYLDHLLAHPTLGPLVEDALVLVPPMAPHEIAAAVEKPAQFVGVATSEGVAEVIFADMAGKAAGLPLMQYALTEMFDHRVGDSLTLDDYHRVGGLGGALARRAEEEYLAMEAPRRDALRRALLQLVGLRLDGDPALRRLPRAAFSAEQLQALERFGERRMVTFDRGEQPTVEISHEALLREWPRLTTWVDAARDDLVAQRRLAFGALEWERAGREDAFLLGPALASRYHGAAAPAAGSLEAAFLETSRARNAATERRQQRTRRLVVTGFGIAAAVALVLAIAANEGRRDADAARLEAEARALASAAVQQAETDTELGLLLAVEAYRADPSPAGVAPLLNALGRISGRSALLTEPKVRTGDFVAALATLGGGGRNDSRVACVVELGPGRFLAGDTRGRSVVLTNAATGDHTAYPPPDPGEYCQLSLDENSGRVIGSTDRGTVLFDLESGDVVTRIDGSVMRAQWIGNGHILGFARGIDPIDLDLGDDSPKVALTWVDPVTGGVTPIERTAVTVSSAPGDSLAVLTDRAGPTNGAIPMGDPPVRRYIVSTTDLAVIHDLGEMQGSNAGVAWSDDAAFVGDVSRSGRIRVWDVSRGEQVIDVQLTGVEPDEAIWLDFAPGGDSFVVVRQGGAVTRHEVTADAPQTGEVQVTSRSVAASSFVDDDHLAVMHEDGVVEIFDFATLPFVDAVANCCGPNVLSFFTDDGGSGLVRMSDESLRVVDLPGGAIQTTDPDMEVAGVWRGPDGALIAHTAEFELIDLANPTRRGQPFGTARRSGSMITATEDPGVVAAWVISSGSAAEPRGVILGRIDMKTLQAVGEPQRLKLPANSRYLQTVGGRLLVGDVMGTIHQFGFDGQPVSPRFSLPFVSTHATTVDGSIALFAGETAVAIVDLSIGRVLSTAPVDSPAPTALLPGGIAVIGKQADGIDLWATEPLVRLGRIANADAEGLIESVSIDETGALWYSSGERYQRISVDAEAWVAQACEFAGGRLTAAEWEQFVSPTRDYRPAC